VEKDNVERIKRVAVLDAQSKRPYVVVLYACSGSLGHKIIAESYCQLLRSWGVDNIALDVIEREHSQRFLIWKRAYFLLLKASPQLWRWLYHHWAKVPGIGFFRYYLLPRRFKRTRESLRSLKPTLVLSTHPIATAIVDLLKRRHAISCPVWVAFSDWHTQPFWIFPNVDHYLVPLLEQRMALESRGVIAGNVSVVGMLLRENFYQRQPPNRQSDFPTILILGGGSGWGLEQIIDLLQDTRARQVVICGSNPRRRKLQYYVDKKYACDSHTILGSVDPIPYLVATDLVISKPGGLTTAEVLHLRKPLILFGGMPGHEDANAKVLGERGIRVASTGAELLLFVNETLASRSKTEESLSVTSKEFFTDSRHLARQAFSKVLGL
jgi:processive 1,2-diacylglycerol beta-glucosyltransferase